MSDRPTIEGEALTQAGLDYIPGVSKRELDQQLIEGESERRANGYTEERDLVNELVGQARAAQAMTQFSSGIALSALQRVKEQKLHRRFKGRLFVDSAGREWHLGTWEGFCAYLGTSARKVDEDLENLTTFGEQMLDAMRRVGLGYRELRKLRQLPERHRAVVEQEVEDGVRQGNKEALTQLIDDLITEHSREREALGEKVKALEERMEASDRASQDRQRKIDELNTELARRDGLTGANKAQVLGDELDTRARDAREAIGRLYDPIKAIVGAEDVPDELLIASGQAVDRLIYRLREIQEEFSLPTLGSLPG